MSKNRKIAIVMLAGAGLALACSGCNKSATTESGANAKAAEHPKGEHPKAERPKANRPAGDDTR